MIIITKPHVTDAEIDHIRERIESVGMRTHLSRGEVRTIIGCIGDEALLAEVPLRSLPGVESVTPVLKPYKLASREFSVDRSVVRVGGDLGADTEARLGCGGAPRRRVQAAHVALRVPGPRPRGARDPRRGARRGRAAGGHRGAR